MAANAAVTNVTVNGVAVGALDPAGDFFANVTVAPGQNIFQISASDASGDTVSTTLTVQGAIAATGLG